MKSNKMNKSRKDFTHGDTNTNIITIASMKTNEQSKRGVIDDVRKTHAQEEERKRTALAT